MTLRLPLFGLMLLAITLPICATASKSSDLRSDILSTARGEFLQVMPMHALTLNANIERFAYEPLGIEVAYAGHEIQGDQIVHFVKTMDVRSGHEMSALTFIAPSAEDLTALHLLGWSSDDKSVLLLKDFVSYLQEPSKYRIEYLRWDLAANPPVVQIIDPRPYLPAGINASETVGDGFLSPSRRAQAMAWSL